MTEPNEYGVYYTADSEEIRSSPKREHAKIHVIETPLGWIAAVSYTTNASGQAEPLSATYSQRFATRAEAVRDAANRILSIVTEVAERPYNNVESEHFARIRAWAQTLTVAPVQEEMVFV